MDTKKNILTESDPETIGKVGELDYTGTLNKKIANPITYNSVQTGCADHQPLAGDTVLAPDTLLY